MAYHKALIGMVLVRMLSGMIEIGAALLMWKLADLRLAIRVNAALGLVGPTILLSATLIGISGLAGRLSAGRLLLLVCGVGMVLLGTR